jgi:hypothetical protein
VRGARSSSPAGGRTRKTTMRILSRRTDDMKALRLRGYR